MRETDSQDAESSAIDDDLDDEEEDVFFRNVSEDLDDEERTSYAILLILAVGGFAVGALLLQITLTAAVVLKEYSGDWAWVLAPAPMLLFGLASLWQYDSNWLQRLGATALGFALAQYIMIAIGFATLEI
jgi:hypothetical protein